MITRILLSVFLFASACETAQAEPPTLEDWKRVLGNPESEAMAALQRGDHRLLGVKGFGTTAPGATTGDFIALWERHGLIMIDNTGDVLGPENRDFKKRAWEYGTAYNLYILKHGPLPNT